MEVDLLLADQIEPVAPGAEPGVLAQVLVTFEVVLVAHPPPDVEQATVEDDGAVAAFPLLLAAVIDVELQGRESRSRRRDLGGSCLPLRRGSRAGVARGTRSPGQVETQRELLRVESDPAGELALDGLLGEVGEAVDLPQIRG